MGVAMTMRAIYEEHSVNRPFLARNYKTVLNSLFKEGGITTDRAPRGSTFANDHVVTFPP